MTHDPMCDAYPNWTHVPCSCHVIAKVRADERERAERAIYKTCAHTKYEGCPPCWHDLMVRDLNEGLS